MANENYLNNEAHFVASSLFSETKDLDDAMAILGVISNRTKRPERFGGSTPREVLTAPHQFSGVGSDEFNKAYNLKFVNKKEEQIYKQFLQIANQMLRGNFKDPTGGADHYVNLKLAQPKWAKIYESKGRFGQHTYFKER